MADLAKKYFELKTAFFEEKATGFDKGRDEYDFENELADIMFDIEKAYNFGTTAEWKAWCTKNIEFPYLDPFND
jgi:hypothetical protein